jgi:glycosyltransferase involved in cell wall biosynthesis
LKKVFVVSNSCWNLLNFRLPLLNALKQQHSLLALAPPDENQARLEAEGIPFYPLNRLRRNKTPLSDFRLFFKLFFLYRKEKPDLILHFTAKPNIYGSLAARLNRIPSLPTLTGLGFIALNKGFSSRLARSLYQIALNKLPQIVFHNPDDLRFFLERKIINPDQGLVIPGSGVDTVWFAFHPLPAGETTKFLMASRLLKDKGVREYAEAAKILKEKQCKASFLIAGELDQGNPSALSEEEWKAILKRSPLIYLGKLGDIREAIREAHCVVLPSYREGLPRFLLEGMAMGRPVITTDVPGCRELVRPEENGFLHPGRNGAALAEAMEQFLGLPASARDKMGHTSRRMVEDQYGEKRIVEMYLNKALPRIMEPR